MSLGLLSNLMAVLGVIAELDLFSSVLVAFSWKGSPGSIHVVWYIGMVSRKANVRHSSTILRIIGKMCLLSFSSQACEVWLWFLPIFCLIIERRAIRLGLSQPTMMWSIQSSIFALHTLHVVMLRSPITEYVSRKK